MRFFTFNSLISHVSFLISILLFYKTKISSK